jgi:hypothetical protein
MNKDNENAVVLLEANGVPYIVDEHGTPIIDREKISPRKVRWLKNMDATKKIGLDELIADHKSPERKKLYGWLLRQRAVYKLEMLKRKGT